MPSENNKGKKMSKFIKKLIQILSDSNCSNIVCFLPQFNGFNILNSSKFIDQVLPKYFKHNNMSSFVRQLNIYGFVRPKQSDQNIYTHPKFIKDNLNSLRQIQRRSIVSHNNVAEDTILHDNKTDDQHIESSEYQQICKKLMNQNKILKLQNQSLSEKLTLLKQQQLYLCNMPFLYGSHKQSIHQLLKKGQSSKITNSQQTNIQKNQYKEDNSKIHSFTLNSNNKNLKRLLSYQALINGSSSMNSSHSQISQIEKKQ